MQLGEVKDKFEDLENSLLLLTSEVEALEKVLAQKVGSWYSCSDARDDTNLLLENLEVTRKLVAKAKESVYFVSAE